MISAVSLLLAAAAAQGCLPVSGGHIVAADLAKAIPEFGSAPPQTPFGYAPNPGATRVLRVRDIERFARQVGVKLSGQHQLCFAWELHPIPEDAYRQAMQQALGRDDVAISILEVSGYPAPPGELVFDPDSLTAPSDSDPTAPVLWRGHVDYGQNRKFAVWARVQLSAAMQRVIATVSLRAGEPIPATSLRVESYRGFPETGAVSKIEDAAGRAPLRPVAEGDMILAALLRVPVAVRRGDVVEVTVESGAAVIQTEGVAEQSGQTGETILIRNTKSDRTFRARITGAGEVVVRVSGN